MNVSKRLLVYAACAAAVLTVAGLMLVLAQRPPPLSLAEVQLIETLRRPVRET